MLAVLVLGSTVAASDCRWTLWTHRYGVASGGYRDDWYVEETYPDAKTCLDALKALVLINLNFEQYVKDQVSLSLDNQNSLTQRYRFIQESSGRDWQLTLFCVLASIDPRRAQ